MHLETVQKLYTEAREATLVKEVQEGYLSRNFILENRGVKFFLKQYRFDSLEKIREIHRAKFFFSSGGIPVILPLQNRNEEYFFEEEGKFYALFPFVSGRIIPRANRPQHAIESAARMLANIHLLSKDGFPEIVKDEAKGWDKNAFLKEAETIQEKIERRKEKSDFDHLVLEVMEYKRKIVQSNTVLYEKLRLANDHIIHGDYYGQNIFYNENDEVKYVFDFEKTKRSPRVLEVIRCVDFMCLSDRFEEKDFEDARVFLRAYSAAYPLQRDELIRGLRAYFFKNIHSLWIEREHYLNENYRTDPLYTGKLAHLQYYWQHFDLLADRLTQALI